MSLETVPAGAAALLLRPYKGLDFYTASEEDALFFVGRDTERKLIVSNQIASRLTILYGASGVVKSSLLNAGVAYQLRHDAELSERGTPEYAVVVFATWREDAVTGLIDAVGREVASHLREATHLLLLCQQAEEGIEDDVDQAEGTGGPRLGETTHGHRDGCSARLGAQPRDHRFRGVDPGHG